MSHRLQDNLAQDILATENLVPREKTDNSAPGQFGTKSLKQTIWHPDNLAPENLAQFTEFVLPTI